MWSKAFLEDPRQPSSFHQLDAMTPLPRLLCLSLHLSCIFPASSRGLESPPPLSQAKGVHYKIHTGFGGGAKRLCKPLRSSCEWLCLGFPANPRTKLFRAVPPFPLSMEKPRWPGSRSLSSLQKAVLPHMQMRQAWVREAIRVGVGTGLAGRGEMKSG